MIDSFPWRIGNEYVCYSYIHRETNVYETLFFDLNHSENNRIIRSLSPHELSKPYKSNVKEANGVLYLYINGSVIYTDNNHAGKWYDSGIRYTGHSYFKAAIDPAFFTQKGEEVFFVTFDLSPSIIESLPEESRDLGKRYRSYRVKTDFMTEVTNIQSLLDPNPTMLPSIHGDDVEELEESLNEYLEDSFGNGFHYAEGSLRFIPIRDAPCSVFYDTGGDFNYITATVAEEQYCSDQSLRLQIYADKKLVWQSDDISCNTGIFDFTVKIDYAQQVEIRAVSETGHLEEVELDGNQIFETHATQVWIGDVMFHNLDGTPSFINYYYK